MSMDAPLDCRTPARRGRLFGNAEWNGIDYVDVGENQKSLCLHFFNGIPKNITLANIRISGGSRIVGVRPVRVFIDRSHDHDLDDCLRVEVDKAGDLSTYRLCLVGRDGAPIPGIDPRYACVDFNFRIDCAGELDCLDAAECEPPAPKPIAIDYLAKDYASFLRLIYDRLALTMPDWRERHAADLGVTLVEILAYVGDYLSYYQDAVATEAYLDTARLRISVSRHLQLIDYHLHEGCNARAFVAIETEGDFTRPAGKLFFITDPANFAVRLGPILTAAEFERPAFDSCEIFEPVAPAGTDIAFRAAHSRILLHDWGERECCLPKGATRATLIDHEEERDERGKDERRRDERRKDEQRKDEQRTVEQRTDEQRTDEQRRYELRTDELRTDEQRADERSMDERRNHSEGKEETYAEASWRLDLKIGDYLIFEEVIGPVTGNRADADPTHRHVVRLTSVARGRDALLGVAIVEIGWAEADALPFPLCLSVRRPAPDCDLIRHVSVARGNIVLVDHGRTRREPLDPPRGRVIHADCACEGSILECRTVPAAFAPRLATAPLTFAQPVDRSLPAALVVTQDPRLALPSVRLRESGEGGAAEWLPRRDLLSSTPDDRHFVAEIDDDGRACLRFGDGEHGRQPEPGAALAATYRSGNGPAGNIESEAIALMVLRDSDVDAGRVRIRNPLPAGGGTAPEPAAEAKLLGPGSIFAQRERAVVAEDYAELARRSPKVQSAAAALRWTGSWYEAGVAVDPLAAAGGDAALLADVAGSLHRGRRIGHDLAVAAANHVPLRLTIAVCVMPQYVRGHVHAALLDAFSARRLPGGRTGFFHPDRLRFGDAIHVSQIVAAAMAVEGVESAKVTELRRLNRADEGALDSGRLAIGPYEIARLDNDPNFPESGQLELILRGGR